MYSAKDILNTMIDDVPCFEENQTLSASLVNSILHSHPFHNRSSLLSLAPSPPPSPETFSLNKMTATWEKSHSQLGGPTSGWLWKKLEFWFGVQSLPIPPGHNLSVRKNISKDSECIQERELPLQQWWTSPRCAHWIPVQTPPEPAHSTPPRKERKSGAALEQDRFLVWGFLLLVSLGGFYGCFIYHIFHPALLHSVMHLWPHSMPPGLLYLQTRVLGLWNQASGASRKGFSEQSQLLRQGAEETRKEACH